MTHKEEIRFINDEIMNRKRCAPRKEVIKAVKTFCKIMKNSKGGIVKWL